VYAFVRFLSPRGRIFAGSRIYLRVCFAENRPHYINTIFCRKSERKIKKSFEKRDFRMIAQVGVCKIV
ncbi:MAG: hypothetical protein J6252_00510, partial [Clostridia bacterium]|nr:hypothetical protein [Clostridia bacterium]